MTAVLDQYVRRICYVYDRRREDQVCGDYPQIRRSAAIVNVVHVPVAVPGYAAIIGKAECMASELAKVFNVCITERDAERLAKDAILKHEHPNKLIAWLQVRMLPWVGSPAFPIVSQGILESAGWTIAEELSS